MRQKKNLCAHIVGPAQVKRVSGFYSKLDGDKGSHNKEHRKATGGTRDVCAQMCVGVLQALCRKQGESSERWEMSPMDTWEQLCRQRAKSTGLLCGTPHLGSMSRAVSAY